MKNGGIQHQLTKKGGPLGRYRRAVVGEKGWGYFFFYELVATLISPLPGDIGVVTRRIFFPFLFEHFGRRVAVQEEVSFRRPHHISIGNDVTLHRNVLLDVKGGHGRIELGDNVSIGRKTILSCPGGSIVLGEQVVIGEQCRLGSLEGLTVGKGTSTGNGCCIIGAGHEYSNLSMPIINQPLTCKGPTLIGEHVTVGKNVTLLDGVIVGNGAVIADGAFVNNNIKENCHVAGVPALPC